MIDVSDNVFQAVKTALVAFNPKITPYNAGGTGFDDNNILSYLPLAMSPQLPYDFVSVSEVDSDDTGIKTIINGAEQAVNLTYQIEIYAKNVADTRADKQDIQHRAKSTLNVITDTMNEMYFIRVSKAEDSNHNGNGIYRIAVRYRRLIGAGDTI